MVVAAPHRQIVMDLEPGGSHLLHRPHLVEHVFERRKVVLQPGVAPGRKLLHRLRHPLGMRRHRPAGDRNPRAMPLAEQLVDRHPRRLTHQVVHRHPQPQAGFVPHPVERIAAQVLLADRFRLHSVPLSQTNQLAVGLHHIHHAAGGAVEVPQFIRLEIDIRHRDLVRFNRGDPQPISREPRPVPRLQRRQPVTESPQRPGFQQVAAGQGSSRSYRAGHERALPGTRRWKQRSNRPEVVTSGFKSHPQPRCRRR